MNKLQWNFNRNSYILIQENPFENIIWKTVAILSDCGAEVIIFWKKQGHYIHHISVKWKQ